jgi:hypothetical protein
VCSAAAVMTEYLEQHRVTLQNPINKGKQKSHFNRWSLSRHSPMNPEQERDASSRQLDRGPRIGHHVLSARVGLFIEVPAGIQTTPPPSSSIPCEAARHSRR